MKLSQIAKLLGIEFDGEDIEIESINTLKEANKHQLSFVANKKYRQDIPSSNAGAILVDDETLFYFYDQVFGLIDQ